MTRAIHVHKRTSWGIELPSPDNVCHWALGECAPALCGDEAASPTGAHGMIHVQALAMFTGGKYDCDECVRRLRAAAMEAAFGEGDGA